ncbi:MAG: hypothetical protein R3195_07040 [Gemmatimonadota bacterium]|nr:hypothetical protein [Gemmatimonadota bacterium]
MEDLDWSPSEGLRAIVAEWLACDRFGLIEFRDTAVGRRAAVRDGPEVWEVAAAALSGPDATPESWIGVWSGPVPPPLREHFSWIPPAALEQALQFSAAYPDDIVRIIERNRRLADRARS